MDRGLIVRFGVFLLCAVIGAVGCAVTGGNPLSWLAGTLPILMGTLVLCLDRDG